MHVDTVVFGFSVRCKLYDLRSLTVMANPGIIRENRLAPTVACYCAVIAAVTAAAATTAITITVSATATAQYCPRVCAILMKCPYLMTHPWN